MQIIGVILGFVIFTFFWIFPFMKGLIHLEHSISEEKMADDDQLDVEQRNRFLHYALADRKKSQSFFTIFWVLILLVEAIVYPTIFEMISK